MHILHVTCDLPQITMCVQGHIVHRPVPLKSKSLLVLQILRDFTGFSKSSNQFN